MTLEDALDDLKQFIVVTVSQQTAELSARIDQCATKEELKAVVNASEARITAMIQDLQSSVSEAIDTSNSAADEQIKDHEKRITRLEHKLA